MAEFLNPFPGMAPDRPMTDSELLRAIRLALSAEEEAIHLYMALADGTTNELAKKVLIDVANEEREHAGEFQRLIDILDPEEVKFMATGAEEVDEMAEALGGEAAEAAEEAPDDDDGSTVGDLRE